jgi:meiotic recombination protein SPO11
MSDWDNSSEHSSPVVRSRPRRSSIPRKNYRIYDEDEEDEEEEEFEGGGNNADNAYEILSSSDEKPKARKGKGKRKDNHDFEEEDEEEVEVDDDDDDVDMYSEEELSPKKRGSSGMSLDSGTGTKKSKSGRTTSSKASKSQAGRSPTRGRSFEKIVDIPDANKVLKKVRSDRKSLESKMKQKDYQIASESSLIGVTQVKDLDTVEVGKRIENLVIDVVTQIMNGRGYEFTIPNRGTGNQRYLEEIDQIVLGDKTSKRQFLNTNHVRKTAITTRVVELVHEVLSKGIHVTKRDLFYTDVKLFKEQNESDNVLDDVACMIGCTRTSLHVVASDKGLVVGRIKYKEAGDEIDCTKMGIGGKAIPPYIDKITDIRSDAEFIILVEKEAAYMRLAEDRVYHKYPCIIITGKGQPDVATRLFLRKVRDALKIPVLGLVDSDPYGLKILSVYSSGSKSMSYDSNNLTTPDIKWLGIRPSDLDKYKLPQQCRLPLTEHDKKTGNELLKEDFINKNPQWKKELELMMKTGEKAEIQALSSFGFQYITEQFLPRKLLEGDWI